MKKYFLLLLAIVPVPLRAGSPAVVINELAWMGTEISANDEWIELHNPTETPASLEGWRLTAVDGSPDIPLSGTIAPGEYFLLERTDDESVPTAPADSIYTGALGNAGEQLELRDAGGLLIDQILMSDGAWPAGDNTTKQTMERANTGGWQTSALPGGTPLSPNSAGIEDIPTDTPQENTAPAPNASSTSATGGGKEQQPKYTKGMLLLSEILPNPLGADDQEFIELYNPTDQGVNVKDFYLKNRAGKIYRFAAQRIGAQQYLLLTRQHSRLPLSNAKEQLTLYAPNDTRIDSVTVSAPAPESHSYARRDHADWEWTSVLTPGEPNTLPVISAPAIVELNGPKNGTVFELLFFDASDSFDPADGQLDFHWDFGDGRTANSPAVRQLYTQPGRYTVGLTVTTNHNVTSTASVLVTIADPTHISDKSNTTTAPIATTTQQLALSNFGATIPKIFISELLPNPVGRDTDGEFIELYNAEPYPVPLEGWQLDDDANDTRRYTFSGSDGLEANGYLAIPFRQSKLTLNNDADALRLFTPTGELVDEFFYAGSDEGVSLVRDEQGEVQPTNPPAPGQLNPLAATPAARATTTAATSTVAIVAANNPLPLRPLVSTGAGILVAGGALYLQRKKRV